MWDDYLPFAQIERVDGHGHGHTDEQHQDLPPDVLELDDTLQHLEPVVVEAELGAHYGCQYAEQEEQVEDVHGESHVLLLDPCDVEGEHHVPMLCVCAVVVVPEAQHVEELARDRGVEDHLERELELVGRLPGGAKVVLVELQLHPAEHEQQRVQGGHEPARGERR